MQIVLHAGAHHTDEDRLLKCLLRNSDLFAKAGTAVPGPGRYRTLLKDAFIAMDKAPPSPEARDILLDAILDEDAAQRLVLSNANFFGSPRFAIGDNTFYPLAEKRLVQLSELFLDDDLELFIALRNPAMFVPMALSKAGQQQQIDLISTIDFEQLLWSDMLKRIRATLPQLKVTAWCVEDTPLTWAQIIREIGGLPPTQKITGGFDILRTIMSPEGMQRFRAYLEDYPTMPEAQKREVMIAFLGKYAIEDALEEELDLPGWSEALVDELTEIYEHDMDEIAEMADVRLITA
ncbi:MAG: hypothetical protein CML02_09065 [Pseudooceanicola sp.]|jgi:hypothetical protein|nr:hypothetical protein [Pseudooceanicola sp.]